MEEAIKLMKQVIIVKGAKGQETKHLVEEYYQKKYREKDHKGVLYTGKVLSSSQMAL